jgi:nitrogen fixation/metabolism regulation signal transduction histidine kinase
MRLLAPLAILVTMLLTAAPALAGDNGEGLVGETDDKIITFFALGLVVFFTLVVILGSAIQGRLEKRKNARKATELRKRVGW